MIDLPLYCNPYILKEGIYISSRTSVANYLMPLSNWPPDGHFGYLVPVSYPLKFAVDYLQWCHFQNGRLVAI